MSGRAGRVTADALDYAQLKEWLSGFRRGDATWRAERAVTARMRLPSLARRPGAGETWAVSTVRDELDVIEASVDHLLDQGVDHVLVSDHLSKDGTREFLVDRSQRDHRVHVALDDEPGHFQKEKISRLSAAAWWAGARWVIPFDADEFWYAEKSSLADFLRSTDATVVVAQMHDLVPVDAESTLFRDREFILDPTPAGDLKVAFRSHPLVRVGPGNHGVARVGRQTGGLHIAHVPYRAVAQVARKFRTGSRALDDSAAAEWEGWHWRAGASLSESELERAWAAIRAGEVVPEIGWSPSGDWMRGNVLRATTWQDERTLDPG